MFVLNAPLQLYQIWIDSPQKLKDSPPALALIGDSSCSVTRSPNALSKSVGRPWDDGGCDAVVTTVDLKGGEGGEKFKYVAEMDEMHDTRIVYVRRGKGAGIKGVRIGGVLLPVHSYALLGEGRELEVEMEGEGEGEASLLIMSGRKLRQPVLARGPFVVCQEEEMRRAEVDYGRGEFGPAWSHELSDEEWRRVVERHWRAMGKEVPTIIQ